MKVDLLLAGSPCQGFSRNGTGLNFEHPKSKLFYKFVDDLAIINPKYFLLENVNMKKEWQDVITKELGVEPIKINSGLVSAQERLRTYWTNIPGVVQPDDRKIVIKDILEESVPNSCYNFEKYEIGMCPVMYTKTGELHVRNGTNKGWLPANDGDGVDMSFPKTVTSERRGRVHKGKTGSLDTSCCWAVYTDGKIRWFSMTEYERLQCLPDGYTSGFSDNQRKNMIGNGWNIATTAYILSFLENKNLGTVVSEFDGMSGGQLSLKMAGISYDKYYASEIEKNPITVTMKHFPNTIQLGDVTKIDWRSIV